MAQEKKSAQTPLMSQYYAEKAKCPDAIMLFRMGDFYETFGQDAVKAAGILGITLTRRANGAAASVELAGFPHHALDVYLPKLVRAGERVAICEQLEDPKKTKKIVRRGIVELVTPGIALNDNILTGRENTFLASVYFGAKSTGVAFLDLSTGEFYTAQGSDAFVDKLLCNLAPKEVLYQRIAMDRFKGAFGDKHCVYPLDEWVWSEDTNREKLCRHFNTRSLKGFGIENMNSAIAAAGSILYYLEFTVHTDLQHINSISRIDEDRYVWIDRFTIRNLELFSQGDARRTAFADVMDHTVTTMGSRMLKKWIALPIKDLEELGRRHDSVGFLIDNPETEEELSDNLSHVGDLERIASRIAAQRALPREIVQLRNSLEMLAAVKERLAVCPEKSLASVAAELDPLEEVCARIAAEIYPDPSNQLVKGGVIADGVDVRLDELRDIATRGKDVLADIQRRESEATGIPLKISFNNVFGYYIEVRNTHKEKVPETWIRKQTLTSAERYITEELKEYEEKILGAEEKMVELEQQIFGQLMHYLSGFLRGIQRNSAAVARLDCLLSFARIARERGYCRPEMNEGKALDIKGGRHPVIETLMPVGEQYVPNDIYLDDQRQQIVMITGPNTAGKSALLRQTALIVLMAQIGSFVPAEAARIGIVDKIFTRVGASDNISQGESTFMVEMLESASILNNVSDRSLLLLDEIGRGTSTYDGISIAWAMVEYIHGHRARPKTLFATHYHELNEIEEFCPRVKNYNVSVSEVGNQIIFIRKLVPGGTEHSFGIHVARMAGMPRTIVDRAGQLLAGMEAARRSDGAEPPKDNKGRKGKVADSVLDKVKGFAAAAASPADCPQGMQLSIFQLDDPVLRQIRDEVKGLDINSLTPLEALNKLSEIKKITGL